MNKKAGLTMSTIILIVVFLIGSYFGFKTFSQRDKVSLLEKENENLKGQVENLMQSNQGKLKTCPDELIINKIPITESETGSTPSNYFTLNGERKEISEFDLSYVIENCDINKTIAY